MSETPAQSTAGGNSMARSTTAAASSASLAVTACSCGTNSTLDGTDASETERIRLTRLTERGG